MKKWCVALFILFNIVYPDLASAQEVPTIETLHVDLWPEYDKPDMLVIYRLELSSDVSPPIKLNFRIPVEAGEPHAVAIRSADGSLLTAPYERSIDGEWAVISLLATMPGIQIEYYDPLLHKDNTHRSFQYTWLGDYPVESLTIQVQQPFDASALGIIPTETGVFSGSDGYNYYTLNLGNQPLGEEQIISIQYTKSSDQLGVERLPVQPVKPIRSSISGRMNLNYIPWGLGILGLSLLTGGIYWYWQLGKKLPKTNSPRNRSTSKQKKSEPTIDETVYCHQCGKRAALGDRYCRSCGSKLRSH